MIGFSIGFGCIPFLLLGELFPADQRSVASAIAGSFNLGMMFIVIKTYHSLDAVGYNQIEYIRCIRENMKLHCVLFTYHT